MSYANELISYPVVVLWDIHQSFRELYHFLGQLPPSDIKAWLLLYVYEVIRWQGFQDWEQVKSTFLLIKQRVLKEILPNEVLNRLLAIEGLLVRFDVAQVFKCLDLK